MTCENAWGRGRDSISRVSDSPGLGWHLRTCTSNQFPTVLLGQGLGSMGLKVKRC
jgi:hypothetical protein